MGAQMNIKNSEAVELAAALAKAEGMSQTELVLEALRAWKRQRESESEQRFERAMQICRETAALLSPKALAFDIDKELYDEMGLPK